MRDMRHAIEGGTFQAFQDKFAAKQAQGDIEEI
jgi:queuine/archaeosine tRNA-ribosyltransferase